MDRANDYNKETRDENFVIFSGSTIAVKVVAKIKRVVVVYLLQFIPEEVPEEVLLDVPQQGGLGLCQKQIKLNLC